MRGFAAAVGQFVLYALGMGFVLTLVTFLVAFFKQAMVARLRGLSRHVQAASTVFLLAAGAYIIYYWLTLGRLLPSIGQ